LCEPVRLLFPAALVLASLLVIGGEIYTASVVHKPERKPVPKGTFVIYEGTFRFAFMPPPPNGAALAQQVFYLEEAAHYYRLILEEVGLPKFTNGTRVRVAGILVVPSSWNSAQVPSFDGDIYVESIVEL